MINYNKGRIFSTRPFEKQKVKSILWFFWVEDDIDVLFHIFDLNKKYYVKKVSL